MGRSTSAVRLPSASIRMRLSRGISAATRRSIWPSPIAMRIRATIRSGAARCRFCAATGMAISVRPRNTRSAISPRRSPSATSTAMANSIWPWQTRATTTSRCFMAAPTPRSSRSRCSICARRARCRTPARLPARSCSAISTATDIWMWRLPTPLDDRVLIAAGNGSGGFAAATSIARFWPAVGTRGGRFSRQWPIGFRHCQRLRRHGVGSAGAGRRHVSNPAGSRPSAINPNRAGGGGLQRRRAVDLATSSGTGGSVLLGLGDGTFQPQSIFATGALDAIASADLNGDGRPDLVTADGSDGRYFRAIRLGRRNLSSAG